VCQPNADRHAAGVTTYNLSSISRRHLDLSRIWHSVQAVGSSTLKHCKPLYRPHFNWNRSPPSITTHDKLSCVLQHLIAHAVVSAPAALLHYCMLTSRYPVSMSVPAAIGSARLLSGLGRRASCLQVGDLPSYLMSE
jgi:hypothetical protein